jgi:BON domain
VALDLKQVDLKQVRDDVADRVGRAAKELGTGAGNAARELSASAQDTLTTQYRKQRKEALKRLPARRSPSPVTILLGAAVGAAVVYLWDPQRGKARRAVLIDWSAARLRTGWQEVNRWARWTTNTAAATPNRMVALRSGPRPADDLTLRDRVESEIFRDRELPKGQINFDVEGGIVTIRGSVDNAFQIATIEKAVVKVPGVKGVENLLHVSGTPAPNKAEARENIS